MNAEINRQVVIFLKWVASGWPVELAFDTCYDMVYDMIGAEAFLDLCLEAIKTQKLSV